MKEIGTEKPLNFLKIRDEIFMWHDFRYLLKKKLIRLRDKCYKTKIAESHILRIQKNKIFYIFHECQFFISVYRVNDK